MTISRRSWPRRLWRWAWLAALLWIAATVALVVLLRFVPPPTSAFMLERRIAALTHGERGFVLRRHWVPLAQMSPELPIALIAAEDQKFPDHHGFDVQAIQDALDDAEEGERLRGASTITQQTAKNLFLWNGRSFVRKGFEAYFTVLLELLWPKRRILEVYANTAEFGDGIYGAAAASDVFFRKPVSTLGPREAALLAAVLPSPRRYRVDKPSAHVQKRAAWIERQVRQLGGPAYVPR